jgi:hypothetical protein
MSMIGKEFRQKKPPDREVVLSKIGRNCNSVAHDLCQLARREMCGGVLQGSVLTCTLSSILNDCNPNNVD